MKDGRFSTITLNPQYVVPGKAGRKLDVVAKTAVGTKGIHLSTSTKQGSRRKRLINYDPALKDD